MIFKKIQDKNKQNASQFLLLFVKNNIVSIYDYYLQLSFIFYQTQNGCINFHLNQHKHKITKGMLTSNYPLKQIKSYAHFD